MAKVPSSIQASVDAQPTIQGKAAVINAALAGGQLRFKRGATVLASGTLPTPAAAVVGDNQVRLPWNVLTSPASAAVSSASDTVEWVNSGGSLILGPVKLYGFGETAPDPTATPYIKLTKDLVASGQVAASSVYGGFTLTVDGVDAITPWGQIYLPLTGDFELAQPQITANATVTELPTAGTLRYINGTTETAVSVGTTLTPAQFDTLFYRPAGGAVQGDAGYFGYSVASANTRVRMLLMDFQRLCGAEQVEFKKYSGATGGTLQWSGTLTFNTMPADPLARLKAGPLPHKKPGMGYSYYLGSAALTVTAPVAKDGFTIYAMRWWTPMKRRIEIEMWCFPNAAGKFPYRTGSGTWTPADDVRTLDNLEINVLDGSGQIYNVPGDVSGMYRGIDSSGNKTRVNLIAGRSIWWCNQDLTQGLVDGDADAFFPAPVKPSGTQTVDVLGIYANSNANNIDGPRGNVLEDPLYASGKHVGFMGPGDMGANSTTTWAGGLTHERAGEHLIESYVAMYGVNAVRRVTTNGALKYGEMMIHVALCAVHGMPVRWTTDPYGGPFLPARYPTNMRKMALTDGSIYGAITYDQAMTLGSDIPPTGFFCLATNTVQGVHIEQAHHFAPVGRAYAHTGAVQFLLFLQYAAVAAMLTVNPAQRDGLAPDSTFMSDYRSWIRILHELQKAIILSPHRADPRWLSRAEMLVEYNKAWDYADARMATYESGTTQEQQMIWQLGLRTEPIALTTNAFAEGVGPSAYEATQTNYVNKPAGSVVYGWHKEEWDVCYSAHMFINAIKNGLITGKEDRYIRKMFRFIVKMGADCQEALERHPWVMIDRFTVTVSGGPTTDWDSYNRTPPMDSVAVPVNGSTLGASALGGVILTAAAIRIRRGETDRAMTGVVNQNGNRNFAINNYIQFYKFVKKERPDIFNDAEFDPYRSKADAYIERNLLKLILSIEACMAARAPSDPTYRYVINPSLGTADTQINQLQGAVYMLPGQFYWSSTATFANPEAVPGT